MVEKFYYRLTSIPLHWLICPVKWPREIIRCVRKHYLGRSSMCHGAKESLCGKPLFNTLVAAEVQRGGMLLIILLKMLHVNMTFKC